MAGEIWKVNGNTWYSKKLIDKVVNLCKSKGNKNSLATSILKILDYKDSKGEK